VNDQETAYRAVDREQYKRLSEPFAIIHQRPDGLSYITGEQCITRLNDVLGFKSWAFRVVEHGHHPEADEFWVLGELTVYLEARTLVRQQFGSQKIKRSRASGNPLDIGFDLKGATTDCLKKCATLVGVALHLTEREPVDVRPVQAKGPRPAPEPTPLEDRRARQAVGAGISVNADGEPACLLDVGGRPCNKPVEGWPARNGNAERDPAWVAEWQTKKYGLPLCKGHQFDVRDGEIQPVRWEPDAVPTVGPDELEDLPF
jgi:hypothetical protein